MNKCIFLDRDGVINRDNPDYVYKVSEFEILPGVIEGFKRLKELGYLLVVITNQSGITKGIYTYQEMKECHDHFQKVSGNLIDKFYFSPYHPSFTESLTRKPESLMFEKAVAKFNVDVTRSWMLGDKVRDLTPAKKLGIKGILVNTEENSKEWPIASDMNETIDIILGHISL